MLRVDEEDMQDSDDDELMGDGSPGSEQELSQEVRASNADLAAVYHSEPTIIGGTDNFYTMVAEASAWTDELQDVFMQFHKGIGHI